MNELSLFNTLFDNAFALPHFDFAPSVTQKFDMPKVDVKEAADAYTLEMDLPGRTDKDVEIELDKNVLTISSHKEEIKKECSENCDTQNANAKDKWLIRERKISTFCRRFSLPEDVDAANVGANFANGVLKVHLPRKALAAPKRIAISAS